MVKKDLERAGIPHETEDGKSFPISEFVFDPGDDSQAGPLGLESIQCIGGSQRKLYDALETAHKAIPKH